MKTYPYVYAWRNYGAEYEQMNRLVKKGFAHKRESLYLRRCCVLARGAMNSILIEFENGQREVVSRNSIRRILKTNA